MNTTPATLAPVGIVGLGRAGSALARSLLSAGLPCHTYSRSGRMLPGATGYLSLRALCSAMAKQGGLVVLAVPDGAIREVACQTTEPVAVVHMSGASGLEVLDAVDTRGALHPLAALQADGPLPAGTFALIEASTPALADTLTMLATRLGLSPALLPADAPPEARALYHAAASITANLSVALMADALTLMRRAGLDDTQARPALARLLGTTAQAAVRLPLPDMLTGPIARGDVHTVAKHMDALADAPAVRGRYQALSAALLETAQLAPDTAAAFRDVLSEDEASFGRTPVRSTARRSSTTEQHDGAGVHEGNTQKTRRPEG